MSGDKSAITATEGGVVIDVKVVPGASRDQFVGMLGHALKIKVAAPPEGGKANAAVCALLAGIFGVSRRDVRVVAGASKPRKRISIRGIDVETARRHIEKARR